MKRDNFSLPLDFPGELIIDNFAGGGGTSTGLEAAFGRPVDIAINHDLEALSMHALNHPHTRHLCTSVWDVDPIEVTGNQPVGLVWLSPDCKHFSKAKGSTPVAKHIRGLAWVGMRWVAMTKPRVMMLENVEEFKTWGPLLIGTDGEARPDPARKGKTFESFVRQLRQHGYVVDWRELRACDNGAPTIRKRLFLVARRDGIAIEWPEVTHGNPVSREVLAGKLLPWRTAAECINFDLPANSIFGRKKDLAINTQRRVAKGLWRHVLTSASPFIVNTANGKTTGRGPNAWSANEPLRTVTTSNGYAAVAPTITPMRGTSDSHLQNGHSVDQPLSTVSAGGTHHALTAAHMTKFNTGSVGYGLNEPVATITAGGKTKRPSTGITQGLVGANLITMGYGEREGQQARTQDLEQPLGTVVAGGIKSGLVAAHLVDMGHGESTTAGTKRWSHGHRDIETPLNTVTASGCPAAIAAIHLTHLTHHGERKGLTPDEPLPTITGAHRGEQAMVAACLEQANGGFYEGDGRAADAPMSTITSSGSNQRLVTAYAVKYYSSGGQWQGLGEPMHTLPTKGRVGLVQCIKVAADSIAPEHRARARQCADLLHTYLPEHFPEPAELVLVLHHGQQWVLVDITLRMLKPPELFMAQSFPASYIVHEIPDPKLLFVNGVQVPGDPRLIKRIPLSATSQVRMCGNSVAPAQAEALVRANFRHEDSIYGRMTA